MTNKIKIAAIVAVLAFGIAGILRVQAVCATNTPQVMKALEEYPVAVITAYSEAEDASTIENPTEEKSPAESLPEFPITTDEIRVLAQKLYAECNGVRSKTRQAAVAWIIFNRLDAGYGDTLMAVMTAPHQFAKTSDKTPVTDYLLELAADVAGRWWAEKNGAENVGRIIPSDYYFFWGDGKENHFRKGWKDQVYWDWSMESPYED
jgi:hypothetical protein